jgi:cellulose biosynthesis protein BcsQ
MKFDGGVENMAKKIFFGNYKGGVGKTTSAYQIGGWMAKKGSKVLLIDLDPQSSLSRICVKHSMNGGLEKLKYYETLNYAIELYSTYIETKLDRFAFLTKKFDSYLEYIENIIKPVSAFDIPTQARFDYIPSTINFRNSRLNDLAQKMASKSFNIFTMRLILNDLDCDKNYDYIIFDCPPTSNMLTQSIFLLSDYYFIPTICDDISSDGVPDYITEIESIYAKYSMNDDIGGILLNALVGEKSKLIGVFETIYKYRNGQTNLGAIEQIDKYISDTGVIALLNKSTNKKYRYNKNDNGIETNYIFADYIKHLDNRSNDPGVPAKMETGQLHRAYEPISKDLIDILAKEL